jgi:hypothetical protein
MRRSWSLWAGRSAAGIENFTGGAPVAPRREVLTGLSFPGLALSEFVRGSVGWDDAFDGGFQFFGFEAEGAGFAFVGNVAGGVDQVHAVGPAGVGRLGGVAEFVEQGRNLDSQLAYAGPSHRGAFVFVFRSREDDLIFDVALHLPDIAGVCLCDVDHQKLDLIFVLIIELVEGGNLPPERRSGVAAEDEHHRALLRGEGGELHVRGFVQLGQGKIGSGVAGM